MVAGKVASLLEGVCFRPANAVAVAVGEDRFEFVTEHPVVDGEHRSRRIAEFVDARTVGCAGNGGSIEVTPWFLEWHDIQSCWSASSALVLS